MGFLRKLLSREKEQEGGTLVPAPTQDVPGLEPIVVQAIENLFPDLEQQLKVIEYARDYKRTWREEVGHDDTTGLLAMLAYSNGRIQSLPSPSLWLFGRFRVEEIDDMFSGMKDAEAWVRSISKPKS